MRYGSLVVCFREIENKMPVGRARPEQKAAGRCRNRCQGVTDMNLPDVPKSGRSGGWVFYMRNGKQCRRRYVKPKDPRTPKQLRSRATFAAASKAYNEALTEAQRQECRTAGAKVQSRPRLGQSGPLTGQLYSIGRDTAKPGVAKTARARKQPAERPVR